MAKNDSGWSEAEQEKEIRSVMSISTPTTPLDYAVVAYAVAPVGDWVPSIPTITTPSSLDPGVYVMLQDLQTRLAKAEARIAELEAQNKDTDTVEAWTLTRDRFIQLAEAASYILNKKKSTKKRAHKNAL